MKKTSFILIVMLLPVLIFIVWAGQFYLQKQQGEIVRLAIQGYDPRSLLSGRYIDYQMDWEKTQPEQLKRLALYSDIVVEKSCNTYNEKEYCHWQDRLWTQKMGNRQRFYIPEENANRLDRLFSGRNHSFEVLYACSKGNKPIATELLIDGKPWREFLNENP